MPKVLTVQQQSAREMIQCDLRYLFTILKNWDSIHSNYAVSMVPYQGLIIDGAEAWVAAMNKVNPGAISAPTFTKEEKHFYDAARQTVKLLEMPYEEIYALLKDRYEESERYFSSLCKPIAKHLHLYDIFWADLTETGHFCGNTILDAVYLPDFAHGDHTYGPRLKEKNVIGGAYISAFGAMNSYDVNSNLHFHSKDYGGFLKSPVGNKFSYRFVLFSILCQVNFVVYAVDQYIVPEISTKLRFAYLLYYYLCNILPQINAAHGTSFTINRDYYSQDFRNAMAHYKIGVYLKEQEIVPNDPMFGMTQKAFNRDFLCIKSEIVKELNQLAIQLESYLGIKCI